MRFWQRFRSTSDRTTARITSYFWLLVLLICGLFLQAYMHNFNIVYITLFFLVGFGIVSEVMGRMNLSRLEAGLLSKERCFANRDCTYRVRLSNPSEAPSYAVSVGNGHGGSAPKRIGAGEAVTVPLGMRFPHRGESPLPPTELSSFYPLPHLRFGRRFRLQEHVIVYPEPRGEPLETLLARHRAPAGEREDFDGVRRYESGDTASLIYWPSVARGENVMSKKFLLEEERRKLRFDFRECGADDEARLSQLTLWTLECEKRGLAFSIAMPDALLESGKEGIDAILETLARY